MVYVDEIDVDQEGIAEIILDENAIAQVARPGTSLKLPGTSQGGGPSQAVRPVTHSGRPITGFVRPSTQSGRPGTMEQAIKTPRTAHTARPMTSASGRYVRLGTASLLTNPDGPFINVAKLNLNNYAQKPKLAKGLPLGRDVEYAVGLPHSPMFSSLGEVNNQSTTPQGDCA
uniref:Tetratricopeptide repeat protein 8 n=1 Tax=Sphaerodactylus townsendi TaxID=933632 RepID=A0ACB8G6R5_9SAUR